VRRLENLGRLASGLAHDFNNFLTVVLCNASLLSRKMKKEERNEMLLRGIVDAGEKASKLTRQLLAFAGRRKSNPIDLCLNDVVSEMSSMLSHMLGDHIELVKNLEPELWTIKADGSQIEQVIMNLVVNARDAIHGSGQIHLETRNDACNGKTAPFSNHAQSRCVTLKITDTGEGMDEETQRRAFEPFFTTKKSSGTGLGLATVRSIVEQCRGDIRLESQKGKGTAIEISFPCSTECVEVAPNEQTSIRQVVQADRSAWILLVEDQEAIRKTIAEALVEAGYTVVQAADGNEGLEAALGASRPFDLLLSDVNMPGISGVELARQVKSHDPQTKVLYMSGHMRKSVEETSKETGQLSFPILEKPFAISKLLETVEICLTNRGQSNPIDI
jgi:CheY-like chemotaxis protein